MNEIAIVERSTDWRRLKTLVLDSVSSPITKRVYNLGIDEFFAWYELEPRPGFTKATVSAWRVALEARGLGSLDYALLMVRRECLRVILRRLRPRPWVWRQRSTSRLRRRMAWRSVGRLVQSA